MKVQNGNVQSQQSALTVGAAEKAGICMRKKTAKQMLHNIHRVVMFVSKGLFPNPLNSVMS